MKYQQIIDWVNGQINTGMLVSGEKLETEKALGERFGVSRQTVRQALGILENEGLIERRQGSGSYVSMRKSRQRSMNIGVISTYIDDYIFPGIIRGIEHVLQQNGYMMQLAFTHNQVEHERRALVGLMEQGVDGLIVEPTKSGLPSPNLPLYKQLQAEGLPIVLFDAYYPGITLPYVALDDRQVGRVATERLLAAGHRQIAGIFQLDDIQGHLRYAGYTDAMMAAGLAVKAEHTYWFATEDIPGLFAQDTVMQGRLADCTAAMVYNDTIATRLLEALARQGKRCPEDLAIVSVDNSVQAQLAQPPLTTVNHPKELLGEAAAKGLLRLMHSPQANVTELFPAVLAERASVQKSK